MLTVALASAALLLGFYVGCSFVSAQLKRVHEVIAKTGLGCLYGLIALIEGHNIWYGHAQGSEALFVHLGFAIPCLVIWTFMLKPLSGRKNRHHGWWAMFMYGFLIATAVTGWGLYKARF